MKILLDECLAVELRLLIPGHEVYCGWKGTKNGRLLARAAGDGFEVMVTSDGDPAPALQRPARFDALPSKSSDRTLIAFLKRFHSPLLMSQAETA